MKPVTAVDQYRKEAASLRDEAEATSDQTIRAEVLRQYELLAELVECREGDQRD